MPSHDETERQYRLLRQSLDAHATLRERYAFWALFFQIALLVCSALFCATTFASDEFYLWLTVSPTQGRMLRGVASVLAFGLSLTVLLVDFKKRSAAHAHAAECWSKALEMFRKHQPKDGEEWPEHCRDDLHTNYWKTDSGCEKIPNSQFMRLKARYLRKVEVSKLYSRHPGCPRVLLVVLFRWRDTWGAVKEYWHHDRTLPASQKPPSNS